MSKNLVFYFSGTGNSLNAARKIAEVLGNTELVFMKGAYEISGSYVRVGFVFPCYAVGIPETVLKYVRSLNLAPIASAYMFSVVTCNESAGNCFTVLNAELKKKGSRLHYGKAISTVGNYIVLDPMEKSLYERSLDLTLRRASEKTAEIAAEIKENMETPIGKKVLTFAVFHVIGNQYFKLSEKRFRVSENCVGCGLCEKLCVP